MPKRSKKQINEDEKKVIEMLQKDSSYSIDDMAKDCGFSRQKIWRIKKRLEENKTIWGYHAVIDNEKLNVNQYIILARLKNLPIDNGLEKNIIDRNIDKLGAKIGVFVKDTYWVNGNHDLMVSFLAENIKKAKHFQEIFVRTFTESISEIQLLEIICIIEKDGFVNPKVIQTKKLL